MPSTQEKSIMVLNYFISRYISENIIIIPEYMDNINFINFHNKYRIPFTISSICYVFYCKTVSAHIEM